MTIDELEKLIKRAEDVLGLKLRVAREVGGDWHLTVAGPPHTLDAFGITSDQCIAKLKKWATPPKPPSLTFTVPTEHCEAIIASVNANGCCYIASASPVVAEMVEALKPYQEQP
jgi:hypothetical protein